MEEDSILYDDPTVTELLQLANDAARLAARNYFGIDAEDVASAVLEVVYKSPKRFERHLEHRGWMWSVFYAEAVKYCNKCVRDFMFYSAEHYYLPAEVRELLEKAHTSDVQVGEDMYINEATLSLIDLARAFDRLSVNEKILINRKIRDREKLSSTERKAYYRATERLAVLLNRSIETESKQRVTSHEGPGARECLSNAQAANAQAAYFTKACWDD